MKLLFWLLGIVAIDRGGVSLLVIDMDGRKPLRAATEFSMERYLARDFPIYADDLPVVVDAVEKAARLIDRKPGCNSVDTVKANHTLVIVRTACTGPRSVTVRLVTTIAEQRFLCDYEVVRNEQDQRRAQRKLMDFTGYLTQ